jgi:hypothetical protein
MNFTGLLDMINGGGAGASGNTFQGGPLSGLLNEIGIKPRGYQDRMDAMAQTRPQARPASMSAQGNFGDRLAQGAQAMQEVQPQFSPQGNGRTPMGGNAAPAPMYPPVNGATPGMPSDPATPGMPEAFVGFDGAQSPMMGLDPQDPRSAEIVAYLRSIGAM